MDTATAVLLGKWVGAALALLSSPLTAAMAPANFEALG